MSTNWRDTGRGPGYSPDDPPLTVEKPADMPLLPSEESVTTDTEKRWPELRSAQDVAAESLTEFDDVTPPAGDDVPPAYRQ